MQFITLDLRFNTQNYGNNGNLNERKKQMNKPFTQMNTICDMENPIWEKTHLEGEAYALHFSSQL